MKRIAYHTTDVSYVLEGMAEIYPDTTVSELREICEKLYPLGIEEIETLKELEKLGWGHLRSSICFCDWLFMPTGNLLNSDILEVLDRIAYASQVHDLSINEQAIYLQCVLSYRAGKETVSKNELMELAGIKREPTADKAIEFLLANKLLSLDNDLYIPHLLGVSKGQISNINNMEDVVEYFKFKDARKKERKEKRKRK